MKNVCASNFMALSPAAFKSAAAITKKNKNNKKRNKEKKKNSSAKLTSVAALEAATAGCCSKTHGLPCCVVSIQNAPALERQTSAEPQHNVVNGVRAGLDHRAVKGCHLP